MKDSQYGHQAEKEMHRSCISLVPIFNHLAYDEMTEIVNSADHLSLKRGETLFRAGESSHSLYIIHKGKVKIYRLSESGKEQLIRVLKPGDFTGELALFTQSVHDDYAETMEASEICRLSRADLGEYLNKYPRIGLKMMQEFANRLSQVEKQTMSFATEDIETRIASYLIELIQAQGSSEITLPLTRKDLASYLGTTPETISRRLSKFEDEGWLRQSGQRRITILDVEALQQRE